MIELILYVAAIFLAILIPCLIVMRYLEWRAWDSDRRIERLRARRLR